MSRKLRDDKTCLNCGQHVEDRYCTHCGQENVETRQTVLGLIFTFIEDLTHYDGKFWSSLRHLFFSPGFLTEIYINGKRKSYLAPIRLYIFASFITFLLLTLIPAPDLTRYDRAATDTAVVDAPGDNSIMFNSREGLIMTTCYSRISQLDSARNGYIQALDSEEVDFTNYWRHRKSIELKHYQPRELWNVFVNTFGKNIPKSLIIYMPLFALVIRIFHKKTNWAYFDHAIFTLHYISFVLLFYLVTIMFFRSAAVLENAIGGDFLKGVIIFLFGGFFIYMTYYFYRAHRVYYKESFFVSFIKSSSILFLNSLFFILMFFALLIMTLMMLH